MLPLFTSLILSSIEWGDEEDKSVKVSVEYIDAEDTIDGKPFITFSIGNFSCDVIASPDAPLPLFDQVISFFAFIKDEQIFFVFVDNFGCVSVCSSENMIMLSSVDLLQPLLSSENISFDQLTGTLGFLICGSTLIYEWKLSDGYFHLY